MGAFSRSKGIAAEREVARLIHDITGWDVKRRVRQHKLDSDLDTHGTPLDGWCIEVKRYAKATRSDIRGWWAQAASEAQATGGRPVLMYRVDRDEWRAVWGCPGPDCAQGYMWTHEGSVYAWVEQVHDEVYFDAVDAAGG